MAAEQRRPENSRATGHTSSIGSSLLPSSSNVVKTLGGETQNSKPSRRMFSIRMPNLRYTSRASEDGELDEGSETTGRKAVDDPHLARDARETFTEFLYDRSHSKDTLR